MIFYKSFDKFIIMLPNMPKDSFKKKLFEQNPNNISNQNPENIKRNTKS